MDCRWNALCQAVDDRTEAEIQRGTISSRYYGSPSYLCDEHSSYNDVPFDVDDEVVSAAIAHGQYFLTQKEKLNNDCRLLNRDATDIVSLFWSFVYSGFFGYIQRQRAPHKRYFM